MVAKDKTQKKAKEPKEPKDPAKKTSPVKRAEKHELYLEITPDKYFALCDGRQIKDYKELAEILETINDDVFNFHVNEQKNDFASWINDVFDERELAEKIRDMRNKFEIRAKLYEHLFNKLGKYRKK